MNQARESHKQAYKEKNKKERIQKQQSWNHSIKRVQRYFGLRDVRHGHTAALDELSGSSSKTAGKMNQTNPEQKLQWLEYDEAVRKASSKIPQDQRLNLDEPAPYERENSVVFVSIDVEACERNNKLITEIGVATLDTDDLVDIAPGQGGGNWMKLIRARHFRINEYKHLINHEFVVGAPDKFEFG